MTTIQNFFVLLQKSFFSSPEIRNSLSRKTGYLSRTQNHLSYQNSRRKKGR
uniref:Uncharacterized protein n=1 Tax=Citrobacter freundii TaxID=546 RepID=A0A2L0W1W5_CITFR|nr:Hypothetical protein [Citrobacter freundii]